jgi:hypothetical protein
MVGCPRLPVRSRPAALLRISPIVLFLLLPGCGGGKTVSGTVKYAGKEVDKGFITFFPADKNGDTKGAKIVGGQYSITGLPSGQKRVFIAAEPEPVLLSAPKDRPPGLRLRPPAREVPANAVGNNQIVDITGGDQTLDFTLERPR